MNLPNWNILCDATLARIIAHKTIILKMILNKLMNLSKMKSWKLKVYQIFEVKISDSWENYKKMKLYWIWPGHY